MELELSLTTAHKGNPNECQPHPQRNSLEGFNPRVEWRETRSSYFLNGIFQGLNKDDIRLEMDNSRSLIIRGQRYLHDVGMVRWRWRLVERGRSTSRRRAGRPFRIPEDVNVGAITARFHHGTLHVRMPKLTRTAFTPYHISIRPSKSNHQHAHRQRRHPHQHPHNANTLPAEQNMQHKTMSSRRVGEDDDVSMIITVENQATSAAHGQSGEAPVPPEEPNAIFENEMRQQPPGYLYPSETELRPMEVRHPDDRQPSPSSRLWSKENDFQDTKEDQDGHRSPSSCLYADLERICCGHEECSGIQRRGHSKPSLCKGLCELLACVGGMTACKLRR